MMTRKDYVLIASLISEVRYEGALSTTTTWQKALDRVSASICEALETENPRFDATKFLSACQYGKLPRASEVA